MYLVSQPEPLSPKQIQAMQEAAVSFPLGYLSFIERYGAGTYRGWMNVYSPDTEVLRPFPEYEIWEHDADSPITQEQIGECISIGTTVDGDFLAVHPQTGQLLWLPRHAERIVIISLQVQEPADDETYATVLDDIYHQVYGSGQQGAVYYEPWSDTRSHRFLRLPPGTDGLTLPVLSGMFREVFSPDLVIENEYTCLLFYQELGGYVRFNYAYGQEVAVMYEQDAVNVFADMEQWLLSHGCKG
ncbi:hypothetical protein [Paenibacillus paeoniae]|uniref:SMI1/KNR4 family protein n=1 Tax=Paenibacillus paeoniae TaxID=2292705 RepID=A0A371P8W0_9BACL|nr:hypothetical protein [Paenibacillus paeoniae]REK71936.1 hypothetical protein DX130_19745 [Paenibacillus paeoniae]